MEIGILDYGVGNLFSLKSSLKRLGATPCILQSLDPAVDIEGLILPGVGGFGPVAKELSANRAALAGLLSSGRPILGVCLGMQLLFERSEEGEGQGLGLLPGEVVRLPKTVKVPQIGWNRLRLIRDSQLTGGVRDGSWVYYVHSYYPRARGDFVVAESTYGVTFAAAVARRQLFGTQFHPEKSGDTGERILKNFLASCRR